MKKNQTCFFIAILLLVSIMSSCVNVPVESSETSDIPIVTEPEPTQPTTAEITPVETTPVNIEPVVPDGLNFLVDWSRPLEIIASQENVIIVGNGNIHEIEGYVLGLRQDYYPQVGEFYLCGIGRDKTHNLPTIQYSLDRSIVGLIMLDEWRYQSDFAPGKLIIYDGTREILVAQDTLSFSLSADGQKVAYLSQNDACGVGDRLYLFDVQTGESELLSECAGPSFVFSMTGQSIVFTEYGDESSTESFSVILKTENAEQIELAENMFPLSVSDDGAYAYALQEIDEDKYDLWLYQNGTSECIGRNVTHRYMNPIIFNRDCSQVIYFAEETYFYQIGEESVRLNVEGNTYCSTSLFSSQYMMHTEETYYPYQRSEVHNLCTDSLFNVVHVTSDESERLWLQSPDETLSFWYFDAHFDIHYLSAEEVYLLYDERDEYRTQLDKIIEQEAYAYRLHETIYRREGELDIMYYLDTENGGRSAANYINHWHFETSEELRQNYINAHYFDLYMLEVPFDGTPVLVAENVSQVWSDEYGVYYISLEEIDSYMIDYFAHPTTYIYEDPDSGTYMIELRTSGDKNGLYYSTDGTTFHRAAYTKLSYVPII